MTRILTIVALLFATPAWATKYLNCEGDISLSENIGKPDFRKNSRKTDVLVEMNENPLTFTTRGETYNECTLLTRLFDVRLLKVLRGGLLLVGRRIFWGES
jgi:hypothetical protein